MKILLNSRNVIEVGKRNYDREVVVKKHTAFQSFDQLVNAPGNYRPSIYMARKPAKHQRELLFLTLEYNDFQQARGDGRRVFRGDWMAEYPHLHPLLDNV